MRGIVRHPQLSENLAIPRRKFWLGVNIYLVTYIIAHNYFYRKYFGIQATLS